MTNDPTMICLALLGLSALGVAQGAGGRPVAVQPPPVQREFRAAWVATVANIDWPSKAGMTTEQQQGEIVAILDRAQSMNLNAIVLQVRPATDALYPSQLEPWSEYLTGQQGRAPEPFYDPLEMWVTEAHKRGIELHCWFNPYRSRHPSARSPIASNHISRLRPDLVRQYGTHLWMDPGERGTQDHSLAVILDVVRRYNIDGVHMDDYFYPYKERGADGQLLDFPDEPSWQRYVGGGGTLSRHDWRRQNVDQFVQRMYTEVKKEKPHVKVGISPFGIYRPGFPAQIQGFDQFAELYADARKWFVEGWVDYFTPQLYWRIEQTAQSYPVLLQWWTTQNPKNRHLWPGNFTSRIADGSATAWPAEEIDYQVRTTRGFHGATGNVHFSMKALMENRLGIADMLSRGVYAQPALVPASPWLQAVAPPTPTLNVSGPANKLTVQWHTGSVGQWLWVVQYRIGETWTTQILPSNVLSAEIPATASNPVQSIAVSAVDRVGNQSRPAVWTAASTEAP
jgi:uncharacterized lipoprotein YddW (UPF0748 family)